MLGGLQGALSINNSMLRFFLFSFPFNLASTWFCIFADDKRILLYTGSINKKAHVCLCLTGFPPLLVTVVPFRSGLYQVDFSKSFRV